MLPIPLPTWVESHIIGTPADNPHDPVCFYVQTHTLLNGPAPNVWHTISVKDFGIPETAKAVFLSGILIITHGYAQEAGNLTVSLRASGSTMPDDKYVMQTLAALIGQGERSNAASWCPVHEGKFELMWKRPQPVPGEWPDFCGYCIQLSIQAYVRDDPKPPEPIPVVPVPLLPPLPLPLLASVH